MGSEFLDELVDTENRINEKEWEDAFRQYLEKRGIEVRDSDKEPTESVPLEDALAPGGKLDGGVMAGPPSARLFPDYVPIPVVDPDTEKASAFTMGQTVNYHRYLPDDSITRIKSTADLQGTLDEIVDETYDNIDSRPRIDEDREPYTGLYTAPSYEQGVKSYICERIVKWFKGKVDFEKMISGEEKPESNMETPSGAYTVAVYVQNSRNLQDIGIYEIDDAKDFFGDSFGNNTYMFRDLWESDIEPENLVRNVAFDFSGPSWHSSSPPEKPVSEVEIDHRQRMTFYEIRDPRRMFEDSWGNIDEMWEALEEKTTEDDSEYEFICSTGAVGWHLNAGIRY